MALRNRSKKKKEINIRVNPKSTATNGSASAIGMQGGAQALLSQPKAMEQPSISVSKTTPTTKQETKAPKKKQEMDLGGIKKDSALGKIVTVPTQEANMTEAPTWKEKTINKVTKYIDDGMLGISDPKALREKRAKEYNQWGESDSAVVNAMESLKRNILQFGTSTAKGLIRQIPGQIEPMGKMLDFMVPDYGGLLPQPSEVIGEKIPKKQIQQVQTQTIEAIDEWSDRYYKSRPYEQQPEQYKVGLGTVLGDPEKYKDLLQSPGYRLDKVGGIVGQQGIPIATAILTKNPNLALASFAPMMTEEAYNDLSNDPDINMTEQELTAASLFIGGANTFLEKIGFGKAIKPFLKKEATSIVKKAGVQGLKHIFSTAGAESLEELLQYFNTNAMAKVFGSERAFAEKDEVVNLLLEGFFGGGVLGGVGAPAIMSQQMDINARRREEEAKEVIGESKEMFQAGIGETSKFIESIQNASKKENVSRQMIAGETKRAGYKGPEIKIAQEIIEEDGSEWIQFGLTDTDQGPVAVYQQEGKGKQIKITPKEIDAKLKEYLGDAVKGEMVDYIKTPEGRDAFGKYKDGLISIVKNPLESTLTHEIAHGAMDMVSATRKLEILNQIQEQHNIDSIMDAEEYLAEEFANVVQNKPTDAKGKILEYLNDVWNMIKSIFGQGDKVQAFYSDLTGGEFKQGETKGGDDKFQRSPDSGITKEERYIKNRVDQVNAMEQNLGKMFGKPISGEAKRTQKNQRVQKKDRVIEIIAENYEVDANEAQDIFDNITDGKPSTALEAQYQNYIKLDKQEKKEKLNEMNKTIIDKDLKKESNLKKSMKLKIRDMTNDQIDSYTKLLNTFEYGDTFLGPRMIETLEHTDIAGSKTIRDIAEVIEEEFGIDRDEVLNMYKSKADAKAEGKAPNVTGPIGWAHHITSDSGLMKSENPVLKAMVKDFYTAQAQESADVIDFEDKFTKLLKASRKSQKGSKSLRDRIAPEDTQVFDYIESKNKEELAKDMTVEQLELAKFIIEEYSHVREYLMSREQLYTRFDKDYVTHIQRTFLETVKHVGLRKAIKEINKQDNEIDFGFAGDTSQVLGLEKFFKYSLRRDGKMTPSKNLNSAVLNYIRTFHRKKALDSVIPKIAAYSYVLGDSKTNGFVKKWLNNKKGRRIDSLVQGTKLEAVLLGLKTITSFIDLGFSIPINAMSWVGAKGANFTGQELRDYLKGETRDRKKKGKEIRKKYQNITGRKPTDSLKIGSKTPLDKMMEYGFLGMQYANYRAKGQFLLGQMTDAEWEAGEISKGRQADITTKIYETHPGEGTDSLWGATTAGKMVSQYKSWAVPFMERYVMNGKKVVGDIKRGKYNTAESRQLIRMLATTGMIGLAISSFASVDDDDRSVVGRLKRKLQEESMSSLYALNAKTRLGIRSADFLLDIWESMEMIVKLEKYKGDSIYGDKGDLKGPIKLKKTFTPSIFKQVSDLLPEEQKKTKGDGKINIRIKPKIKVKPNIKVKVKL